MEPEERDAHFNKMGKETGNNAMERGMNQL